MKIAFIVQHDWLRTHFGVRNLFVSLYKILKINGLEVDFIFYNNHRTKILWYRVFVDIDNLGINQTSVDEKREYEAICADGLYPIQESIVQFLGTDINDFYHCVIFTNPWLINNNIELKIRKQILICYDMNANKIALKNDLFYPWGFEHNGGYQYALDNNIHFLSISKKTDSEMCDFYKPKQSSFLPAVPSISFFGISYEENIKKENAIVLAAPFDERKGLKRMPDVLNEFKNDIDTLYIFGRPRCGKKEYDGFYKSIRIKNIVHYYDIASKDLIDLYKKCKLLYFPSIEEGLGLPLLEAQLCGCRAVTTNMEPMSELTLDGGYLLSGDFTLDVKAMKSMLRCDDYDYYSLSLRAKKAFSPENIYNHLQNVLMD